MARKRIVISSSGGISVGSPFVLHGALFVEQASPPFAFTQRLAALSDAVESIVAPGVLGAPHTFVVGEGATDAAGGDRSVLIGYNVKQNPSLAGSGGSVDQVLIGNSITIAALGVNGPGTIIIGAGAGITVFAAAPSVGSNVIIGRNAVAAGINAVGGDPTNNVLVGDSATSTGGGSVVLGNTAVNVGSQGVSVGQQAATGPVCVAVGYKAGGSGAATDVTVGGNAKAGSALCVALGSGANNSASHGSIALGANVNTNGKTGAILIGTNANVAADNFCQIGGDATYFISEMRFGRGNSQGAGGNTYIFNTTTAFNANTDGNTLQLRAGAGTGSSVNAGNLGLDLQVGILGAAGSTPQVYTSVLAMRHSDLNAALWGGLTAPFSGGKGVLFIKNATTNPTVAAVAGGGILSVQGGELHFLSSAGVDNALTPVSGGTGSVLSAQVTLTDAQIKALGAGTPVTLVAAPGAGKVITVLQVLCHANCSAGLYGNILGGNVLDVTYNGGGVNASLAPLTNGQLSSLLGAASDNFSWFNIGFAGANVLTQFANLSVTLLGSGGLGTAFTGGNAANSMTVTVYYLVTTP